VNCSAVALADSGAANKNAARLAAKTKGQRKFVTILLQMGGVKPLETPYLFFID
jgi:hypothetical protein